MSDMTETVTIERKEMEIEIEVTFSIYGEYHRATWTDPEEHPEVEITDARPVNVKTGKTRAKPIKLTRDEHDSLWGVLLGRVERHNRDMADEARISAHEARMDYDGDY